MMLRDTPVGRVGSHAGDYKLGETLMPDPPAAAAAAAAEVRLEKRGLGPRRWNSCTSTGRPGRHADASPLLITTTDAAGKRVDRMASRASTITFSKPAVSLEWDCRASVDRKDLADSFAQTLRADREHSTRASHSGLLPDDYQSPQAREATWMATMRREKTERRKEMAELRTVYDDVSATQIMHARGGTAAGGGGSRPKARRPRATKDDVAAVRALPDYDSHEDTM